MIKTYHHIYSSELQLCGVQNAETFTFYTVHNKHRRLNLARIIKILAHYISHDLNYIKNYKNKNKNTNPSHEKPGKTTVYSI